MDDSNFFEFWYLDSCRRHEVLPNKALKEAFSKADVKKSSNQLCSLVIFLDDLKDSDFLPLFEIFLEIDDSEIDAVDIIHVASSGLIWEYVLLLLRAISQKLRFVDLRDLSFGKEFLRDLSQTGLTSQVLNLKSSRFRKLDMVGKFSQLHILNLDFSTSLSSFHEDCFTHMPNLKCLSLCETRISNLWTTSSALSKLPSLEELRFQIYLPCDNQEPGSSGEKTSDSSCLSNDFCSGTSQFEEYNGRNINLDDDFHVEDLSDDSVMYSTNSYRDMTGLETFSDSSGWTGLTDLQTENSGGMLVNQDEERPSSSSTSRHISQVANKYISYHPSPICYERHYRDYMVASLPKLKLLDHFRISKVDREKANIIFSENFEYLPYRKKNRESVTSILQKREIGGSHSLSLNQRRITFHGPTKSQISYSRSLSAAKVGSSDWPSLHRVSVSSKISGDGSRTFRARQFEYHPSDSRLMAFGTLDGEVVVINHENDKLVCYIPSLGAMTCVLGLCWLKNYPSKLLAGSDNGSLKLFDIKQTSSRNKRLHSGAHSGTFDNFDQLTSVHVNSTDDVFLASGYSKDIALYDINSGRQLQVFTDMHQEHINVVKFANHSPSIFATSSFDHDVKMWDLRQRPIFPCYTVPSSRGNVMACFSPDDHYLLVSAVDNEVKQLYAADGRLHLKLNLDPTGSSQNYTRSYYMNGRDYIITGSCDENVVRICCAQTGRRLRDVSLEGKRAGASMFVQSLRGDPFRDFNMSILAAYIRPSSNSEIVKVNLLASNNSAKDCFSDEHSHSSHRMGG